MKLSRRDFVKLWGVSTAPAGLSGLGGGQALAAPDEAPARPGGREILPIPDIQQPYPTAMYGKDVPPQPAQPLRPPEGAPNVVIILIDDMGFGASSAFGGPIHMPTLERVAAEGLKYNRFHTPDLVDHAIAGVQAQQTLTPDRPFFVYLSLGTTHAL